jgi:hypothetical protein
MTHADYPPSGRNRHSLPLFAALVVVSILISLATVWSETWQHAKVSLGDLANLVGQTTEGLLHGQGLTACTEAMGTPGNPICFHAGRMPMASVVVATGIALFGDRVLPVDLFKTLLFLIPLQLAAYLVWLRVPSKPGRKYATALLLLAPFIMTAFLADVTNLQVEEGYSYSLIAMALAILFFASAEDVRHAFRRAAVFGLLVAGVYLAKSSMLPVAAVLTVSYLALERRTGPRALALLLVLAAPVGWAFHQHHASGRYSIGTSLDGINLHKANNDTFLGHYTQPEVALDRYDADLNRGLHFNDEWTFNDYHQRAAILYARTHPLRTLHASLPKARVIFFSIDKVGSGTSYGARLWLERAGFLLFRLILWTAIVWSILSLFRPVPSPLGPGFLSTRAVAIVFLAFVGAAAFPYFVGFAYSRHVSIMIYPAVLVCCRMLQGTDRAALS